MPKEMDATATDSACIVYAIGEPGSNTVKIGRTVNLKRRLAAIQRMSPVRLVARWTHPDGLELERRLHLHFQSYRSHGEWFTFPSDPIPLIAQAAEGRPWAADSGGLSEDVRQKVGAHLRQLMDEVLEIADPMERLAAIERLNQQRLEWSRRQKAEIARGFRGQGLTWKKVGEAMGGVSQQRAHQYAYGLVVDGKVVKK